MVVVEATTDGEALAARKTHELRQDRGGNEWKRCFGEGCDAAHGEEEIYKNF